MLKTIYKIKKYFSFWEFFVLYGIKFEDDANIYYTTKANFDIFNESGGAFQIVNKRFVINTPFFRYNVNF